MSSERLQIAQLAYPKSADIDFVRRRGHYDAVVDPCACLEIRTTQTRRIRV
jgi:hypothetical protein